VAAQKAKMKAVEKKLAKFEAAASEEDPKPKTPRKRKQKVVEEEDEPEHKVVADDMIAKEKERMQKELMLQRMRSVIPNYPG
jgi:hypothetical protein